MAGRKHIDRERVLETAITLADQNGIEAVTLASVADCLGIRIPSLYNHVNGLPGLRREMTLWGLRSLSDTLRRAAVGVSGDEAITRVAEAYRVFALAHTGVYAATLRAVPPEDTELSAIAAELVDIVVAVLRPYAAGQDDALHKVRALRSVMHGFVDLELSGGFGMALDRDESFRRLVRLFIAGLRQPAP
jgi:AcrR family transcriptional regulator